MYKNIYVLGDSWAWGADLELEFPDVKQANEIYSWGGIVSNYFNSNLILCAQRGCSNREIMHQLDNITPTKDDLILISLTTPYRDIIGLNSDKWGKLETRCRFRLSDASTSKEKQIYYDNFYSNEWFENQTSIFISRIFYKLKFYELQFLIFESFARLPDNHITTDIKKSDNFVKTSMLSFITGEETNIENDKLTSHSNLSSRLHPNHKGHSIWADHLIQAILHIQNDHVQKNS